jgi:hypothetical protein
MPACHVTRPWLIAEPGPSTEPATSTIPLCADCSDAARQQNWVYHLEPFSVRTVAQVVPVLSEVKAYHVTSTIDNEKIIDTARLSPLNINHVV